MELSLSEWRGHTDEVLCVDVLNELAASGSEDRTVRLWDPRVGGRAVRCVCGVFGADAVTAVALAPAPSAEYWAAVLASADDAASSSGAPVSAADGEGESDRGDRDDAETPAAAAPPPPLSANSLFAAAGRSVFEFDLRGGALDNGAVSYIHYYDDFNFVVTPVPEPRGVGLLLMAAVALLGPRRRSRSKHA